MEETTREAVERLLRLCEEALRRVEEEPDEDFTAGLDTLQSECHQICDELRGRLSRTLPQHECIPFRLREEHEDWLRNSWGARDFYGVDPMNSGHEGSFSFPIWCQSNGYDSRNWWLLSANFNNGPKRGREELKALVIVFFFRWIRFLNEELEKLGTASLAPAPEASQEAEQLSETDLLKLHFPYENGQETAEKILELMRQGLSQDKIRIRVGMGKTRVWEVMKQLRRLFPDLATSSGSSETVRKTPRR